MQLIAVDMLYEALGIYDVIYIDKNELAQYDGEYVVLPVAMPMFDYHPLGLAGIFSSRIIPVFIALTLVKDTLQDCEVAYLEKYSPIGCRDERTLNIIRSHGLQGYLAGCVTMSVPTRGSRLTGNGEVFLVDVEPELLEYLPDTLSQGALKVTHFRERCTDPKQTMLDLFDEYRSKARLVITPLLHCAIPCVASGIPVVIARKTVSYRFSWVEKLLPVYSRENWDLINWDPNPVKMEYVKSRFIEICGERLFSVRERWSKLYKHSEFFEAREKQGYINDAVDPAKEKVREFFEKLDSELITYSFWGVNQLTVPIYQYISNEFPNARLKAIYDSYRNVTFQGIDSQPISAMRNDDEIILVTAYSAKPDACKFFASPSMQGKKFIICWEY